MTDSTLAEIINQVQRENGQPELSGADLTRAIAGLRFVQGDGLYPETKRYVRNAVRCKACGDTIESVHRHDFRTCGCGAVSVDGGLDYLKRVFKTGAEWDELSEERK